MSTNPNIQVLPDYLKTPEFDAFKKALLEEGAVGDFTLGEIFENDPIRLNKYFQSEYLQQKAEQGDEQALALVDDDDKEITNATHAYLQRYLPPDEVERTRLSLDTAPLETVAEPQPRSRLFPARMGATAPVQLPVKEDATDYSGFTESILNEEDRQKLVSFNVDPDVIYQGDQSFYEKYMEGQFPAGTIDKDSPWRVKAFFFPINMTPFEAEKLLEQESPNAEFRYINPRDKSMGLAIRDESTNGRFVPLRPQFGLEAGTEELITGLGQEMGALFTELVGLKGLGKLIGEGVEQTTLSRKAGRGAGTVAIAGFSAGIGRFAQLAYGNAKGINEVSIERAFEDAGLAAVLGGAGAAVVGTAMATVGQVWKTITGSNIPQPVIDRLQASIAKVKTKGTGEEFTSKELTKITRQAALAVGDSVTKYRPTAGELTQDDFLKSLEIELFSQLSTTAKGRQAYEDIVNNNSNAAFNFWQELTENAPELKGISYTDFREFLKKQQDDYAAQAAEAAKLKIRDIEEGAKLDEVLPEQSPEQMLTIDELGSTFTRDQESGSLIFKRNSPEFLAQSDEAYNTAKDSVAREIDALSGLKYDRKTDSATQIIPAFREAFNAGEDKDAIMRTLGEVEASDVIKSMIPMRDGISILKQLLGVTVDDQGKFLKQADLDFGQLAGMQNALNSLFMESSDRGVREVAMKLRDAVEAQIDDLITFQARKQLAAEGVEAPTAKVLGEKVQEIAGPLIEAQAGLRQANQAIERRFIRELVDKEPSEIADFVLSSSPKQITQLLDQIYQLPDSIVRMQNLRQLVVENMRKSMGSLPLAEQNKAYAKFLEKNSDQLKALFPEAQFLKLTNFQEVQEQALKDTAEAAEELAELEKKLGKSPAEFISDFLLQGRSARLTGAAEMSRREFGELIKENPKLRPYVTALTRDFFQKNFETTRTAGDTMFSGGLDVNRFIDFIQSGVRSGQEGSSELGQIFGPLLGKEEGLKFAKNLRMLAQILDRGVRRSARSPMSQGPAANQTIDDFLQEMSFAQRILIPPLTQTGRRVTALMMGYRDQAKSDLLEVLADPTKLDILLKNRADQISRRDFYKFLGALAVTREVDIGTETSEDTYDRAIKGLQGPVEGVADLFSRMFDDED
tara:strand:- start:168 stop:3572 length:3405 start_codon:yes stop_codon:yes gene_type:complete